MFGVLRRKAASGASSASVYGKSFHKLKPAGSAPRLSSAVPEEINCTRRLGNVRTLSHLPLAERTTSLMPKREVLGNFRSVTSQNWNRLYSSDSGISSTMTSENLYETFAKYGSIREGNMDEDDPEGEPAVNMDDDDAEVEPAVSYAGAIGLLINAHMQIRGWWTRAKVVPKSRRYSTSTEVCYQDVRVTGEKDVTERDSAWLLSRRARVICDGSLWWEPSISGGQSFWIRDETSKILVCAGHSHSDATQLLSVGVCEFRGGEKGIQVALELDYNEIIVTTDCEDYFKQFERSLKSGQYPPVPVREKHHTDDGYGALLEQRETLIRTLQVLPIGCSIKLEKIKRDDNGLADVLAAMGRVCPDPATHISINGIEELHKDLVATDSSEKQKTGRLHNKIKEVPDAKWEKIKADVDKPFAPAMQTEFIVWNGVRGSSHV